LECGDDGCGGSCGTCLETQICEAGKCEYNECDDGNGIQWDGCTEGQVSEFQANTYVTDDQYGPDVASFPDGHFVVVWTSKGQDGDKDGIYGRRYGTDGKEVGGEFQVNTFTGSDQWAPDIAPFPDGRFVVVWESHAQDGDGLGVFGQRFEADGSKMGLEFQVNTTTASHQQSAEVATFPDGRFLVVWASLGQDGDGWGVYAQLYKTTGIKNGPEFKVNTTSTSYQWNPAVAAFADGRFVVLWQSFGQDGFEYGVYGQRFSALAAKEGAEFLANTYVTWDQEEPSVAGFGDGQFLAAWESEGQDGFGHDGVFSQLFQADGVKKGAEVQVNTFALGDQWYPAVAAFGDGRFVVAWISADQDGSGNGVFGQLYAADGNKQGKEFRLNAFSAGDQEVPSVAAFPDGKFVAVWHSQGQDGNGNGIYVQRFNPDGTKIVH
jgi:hypothetical protein